MTGEMGGSNGERVRRTDGGETQDEEEKDVKKEKEWT